MTAAKALAVVIARAGSKGLPGKNAKLLCGRPMITWTIDAARDARFVEHTIVSTDCPTVRAAAQADDVPVIDRPEDLASDVATVDAAVRHAVEAARAAHTIIVMLYANVPIRPAGLIDCAIDTLRETGADSVQSYSPVGKHHPAWMVKLDDELRITPYQVNRVYRRQDLPALFIPDGGVIAVTRSSLFTVDPNEPHAFLGRDRRGITTQPGDVVDIDDSFDLTIAETMLRARAQAAG